MEGCCARGSAQCWPCRGLALVWLARLLCLGSRGEATRLGHAGCRLSTSRVRSTSHGAVPPQAPPSLARERRSACSLRQCGPNSVCALAGEDSEVFLKPCAMYKVHPRSHAA